MPVARTRPSAPARGLHAAFAYRDAHHANTQRCQSRATVYEEAVRLLKNLPDDAAQDVLQRIRSGTDIATVVNHVQAGDILLQMAVAPETRLRYDFPYRSEMPEFYIRDNPYLDSLVYEAASLYSANEIFGVSRPDHGTESQAVQSIYLKPFHAAHVVEPRLTDANISSWTSVCDDNVLMRDLVRSFLRCEYQFTAAFQMDLFLEDLAAQREDFCSSLLVNIVLAYACVCYPKFTNRVEYWNPQTYTYRFFAEAKRLWELESSRARITTVQAGILFSVFHNLCGLDDIGQPYRIQGVVLAQELGLLKPSSCNVMGAKRDGWAYTAWALYNWETLVAFSFMLQPLIKAPPDWPLPDPSEDGRWYGEIWLQYPLVPKPLPTYFGHMLQARSRFRVIMNEYCEAAFAPTPNLDVGHAKRLHERLTFWASPSPHILLPSDSHDTLVRLYYLRHGFEAMDLFVVGPLMLTGYDCIDALGEETSEDKVETLRSTLILVAKGLQNQRRNHYLAEALYRVVRGRMRPQEVAILRSTMNYDEAREEADHTKMQAVRSHWPVSIVKKQEEVDSHILNNLVESYGSLHVGEAGT
ncbi:Nitrogen assimilation transcription factor nirA [Colletotrichum orbiculare MAFF 240422]|uniref:Nitrogen assimilation transcription factor nirA n=1 Tax=Colletotrichum orbiculare (strain 104-T / ATCC 96160 / CBS 514.97 / LARS 414 / MAFF 240422) TaxID=1213857 RepID=A0A484FWI2_COLOR|nr:Nitrogen assimilation transcription factor nirA [Colletotrichum orbiculare MAFF 240422]